MWKIILWVILSTIVLSLLFIFLPVNPGHSDSWDCDDNTLFLYDDFTAKGFEVNPVVGNLEPTREPIEKCNHAWLFVKIAGLWIPYYWAGPCPDYQHTETYHEITYEKLHEEVVKDLS